MSGTCSAQGDKGAYRILYEVSVVKRPLDRPKRRWIEVGSADLYWFQLTYHTRLCKKSCSVEVVICSCAFLTV